MVHDLVVVGIGVIDAVGHVVHFVGREAGCDPESIDWPSVKVIEELEFWVVRMTVELTFHDVVVPIYKGILDFQAVSFVPLQ